MKRSFEFSRVTQCRQFAVEGETPYAVVISRHGTHVGREFIVTRPDMNRLMDAFEIGFVDRLVGKTFDSEYDAEADAFDLLLVELAHRRQGVVYVPPRAHQVIEYLAIMLSMMLVPDVAFIDAGTVRNAILSSFFYGERKPNHPALVLFRRRINELSGGVVHVEEAESEFNIGIRPPVAYLKLIREQETQYVALTPSRMPIVFLRLR